MVCRDVVAKMMRKVETEFGASRSGGENSFVLALISDMSSPVQASRSKFNGHMRDNAKGNLVRVIQDEKSHVID